MRSICPEQLNKSDFGWRLLKASSQTEKENKSMNKYLSRRDFLKLAGGAVVTVAGVGLLPNFLRKTLHAESVVNAATDYDLFFAGTDGWFWLPPAPALPPYFPDDLAPAPFNAYIFGFRDVTDMTGQPLQNQRFKAQHNAPFFWADEDEELKVQITNLGLQLRPDLTDAHTLHWHGFRNVIPYYDGEPSGSLSVPVGEYFTYVYKPHEAGTYMFHCHVEDVEHVTMGMTGLVFVRPLQNGNTSFYPSGKYAYNDGDGSTGYDREFGLFLSEFWAKGHWGDSHIQESQWYEFEADYSMLNGRVYPETLLPNSPINDDLTIVGTVDHPRPHALTIQTDANGDMRTYPGQEKLQYNPHSALVTCNAGERVLLRFANLGFREAAMTLTGIDMTVVGRDATPMKGRDGADTSYVTNTLLFGAGESFDAIFTAPAFSGGSGSSGQGYDTYVLYNRRYTQDSNLTDGGAGGQRTEVRVYPAGTFGPQQYINQHPDDQHYLNGVLQS
jgi:FtsP/CotA-like multicopper oxidase with cupredoxin domain